MSVSPACPVFFLGAFTLPEERQTRTALSRRGLTDGGVEKHFGYAGCPWPESDGGGKTYTIEDLRDLFEASEPLSPFFNPNSPIRLANYPGHFHSRRRPRAGPTAPQRDSGDFGGFRRWTRRFRMDVRVH